MVSRARHLADLIKANSTISIPTGSSGQRPSGESGMFRLNTTNNYFEGYTTSGWSQFDGTKTFINSTVSPTNPAIGDLWLNTTNTVLSVYTTSGWIKTAAGSATNRFVDVFVANASQNTFTTSYNYSYVDVYKNNIRVPTTDFVANNGISVTLNTSANANDIIEVYSFTNASGSAIGTGGLTISSVVITNSAGAELPSATGFAESGGGYISVTGTNFTSGITASIGGTTALNTTYLSTTSLRVQVPPKSAGTYAITLTSPSGNFVTLTNAINYYSAPLWITVSTLPSVEVDVPVSIQLQANNTNSFSLQLGSSLPSTLSLNSNTGTISGALSLTADPYSGNSYTSTFVVNAFSANNVNISKNFDMFVSTNRYVTQPVANTSILNRWWIYESVGFQHRFMPPHLGNYDILVVAGGGSGGQANVGAGQYAGAGGAGGLIERANTVLNSKTSIYHKKVSNIHVIQGGSGYVSTPNVVITVAPGSNDNPSINATATATVLAGNVQSVTITNNGLGYTQPPTVTITGGGGTGAQAIATIGGSHTSIVVGSGGTRGITGSLGLEGNGANSIFIPNSPIAFSNVSLIWTAIGGGRALEGPPTGGAQPGRAGGSGGGGSVYQGQGGSGLQPLSPSGGFGSNGTAAVSTLPPAQQGGGGGGGASGTSPISGVYSTGGPGRFIPWAEIRGTDASNAIVSELSKGWFASGGTSFGSGASSVTIIEPAGGGGIPTPSPQGHSARVATGGGGAAGPFPLSASTLAGGSGIVLIRQQFGYSGDILLAAGGGNGGTTADSVNAGGGGAGGLIFTSNNEFNIVPGYSYAITIGAAGANSSLVHTTYSLIAIGGGAGGSGSSPTNTNGSAGGSGGGKGGGTGAATTAGNTTQAIFSGCGTGNIGFAGGGGGAGGIGNGSGSGGEGITWINGNTYCRGGDEGRNTGTPYPANSGGGGHGGASGSAGVCIIAYAGSQRGSGGTITSSNGYTYHTFTANGTFVG